MSKHLRAAVVVFSGLVLACGGKDPVQPPPALPPILFAGEEMGPRYQHFTISRGARSVAEAKVSVNGTALTATADGRYDYSLPAAIPAGEQLVVRVELDGDVVTATATIPPIPVVTTPVQNQHVVPGEQLPFAWTTTASPAWWEVILHWDFQSFGYGAKDSLPGTVRTATLSTATMQPALTEAQAFVSAYISGAFTGPMDPASNMRVRVGLSGPINLVVGPTAP